MLREWKTSKTGRKYLQATYLIKDYIRVYKELSNQNNKKIKNPIWKTGPKIKSLDQGRCTDANKHKNRHGQRHLLLRKCKFGTTMPYHYTYIKMAKIKTGDKWNSHIQYQQGCRHAL